jgi:hypothetical protein
MGFASFNGTLVSFEKDEILLGFVCWCRVVAPG